MTPLSTAEDGSIKRTDASGLHERADLLAEADGRPTRIAMMMGIAHVVSNRATCKRLAVGCVITNPDMTQVLAIGYNGNARGLPNTCDSVEAGQCGCIHAEVNALLKAPYDRGELLLFTTTAPCGACAKLILNTQVRTVVYAREYRVRDGVELLWKAGVRTVNLGGRS